LWSPVFSCFPSFFSSTVSPCALLPSSSFFVVFFFSRPISSPRYFLFVCSILDVFMFARFGIQPQNDSLSPCSVVMNTGVCDLQAAIALWACLQSTKP
jgi:hypothetical protein